LTRDVGDPIELDVVDLGLVDLASELRRSLFRSTRRIRAEKSDDDLSDSQYFVLAVLDHDGPRTPGELAATEGVRPPTMSRTLTALTARGLVRRRPDPADARSSIVEITGAGSAETRRTRDRRNAWLAGQIAELDDDERAVLSSATEILRRIAAS
jgi:DNA-binding MarR family transcriptional regulator